MNALIYLLASVDSHAFMGATAGCFGLRGRHAAGVYVGTSVNVFIHHGANGT